MISPSRSASAVVILGLVAICAWAQDADWRSAYKEAFYKNALSVSERILAATPEMKDASAAARSEAADRFARGATECHMIALAAYSPKLQEAAFIAIKAGGSYADAKMAFDTALGIEGAAGGEREAAIKKMYAAAAEVGAECIKKLKPLV